MKFAANLSTMFQDQKLEDRFYAARHAGFSAVEIQYPYEVSPEQLSLLLNESGLELVLFNARANIPGTQFRGLACLPNAQTEFRASINEALHYAATTQCQTLHVLCGVPAPKQERENAVEQASKSLAWATGMASRQNVSLVIEVLNQHDVPGYLLRSQADAADLIARVQAHTGCSLAPRVLFDTYHAAMNNSDPVQDLLACAAHLGHVQIADVPGRRAPDTGHINWHSVFSELRNLRYDGHIGCEYFCSGHSEVDYDWMHRFGFKGL